MRENLPSQGKILVVDDDPVVRDAVARYLTSEHYTVSAYDSGENALVALQKERWDAALIDIKMPGMDGMELQRRLAEVDPDLPVIMMTGYASVETAVDALKRGAYDYITKPYDPDQMCQLVRLAVEHRKAKNEVERLKERLAEALPDTEMIGQSAPMRRVMELIDTVAGTDATVLISGESGTGKEIVARSVHAASHRAHAPLVTIHCGALTETLLESELFGYEKGAFTGAYTRKKGKFEAAEGGTVFLDEISDISLKVQTDLLRVLQEREIVRVGGNLPVAVDFRCIAATNRRLDVLAREGAFRADLFYRLNVFMIEMPPLRERKDDIPLLANHFLKKHAPRMNRALPRLSQSSLDALMAYDWPGNVRELENVMERAILLTSGDLIQPAVFPFAQASALVTPSGLSLESVERAHIERTLQETKGNFARAARILEIDRTTLYNKLKRWGLDRSDTKNGK
jgi:DNA-binding NtrC family response regulator